MQRGCRKRGWNGHRGTSDACQGCSRDLGRWVPQRAAGETACALPRLPMKAHPGLRNECRLGAGGAGVDSSGSEVNGRCPKRPAVQAKDPRIILESSSPSPSTPNPLSKSCCCAHLGNASCGNRWTPDVRGLMPQKFKLGVPLGDPLQCVIAPQLLPPRGSVLS